MQCWQLGDEVLVLFNGTRHVKVLDILWPISISEGGLDSIPQWLTKMFVKCERDDGFGQIVEVPAKDICSIVDGVPSPGEALAIPVWGIKCKLELLDPLF